MNLSKLIVFSALFLSIGCHSKLIPGATSRDADRSTVPVLEGTVTDPWGYVSVEHLEHAGDLLVVSIDGQILNKYEFKYDVGNKAVIFRHQVAILGDGSLTWAQPPVPAAPLGSHYKISFE